MINFSPNQKQVEWANDSREFIDEPMRGCGKSTYLLSEIAKGMVAKKSNYVMVAPNALSTGGFKYYSAIIGDMLRDHKVNLVARGRKVICEAPDGLSVLMFYDHDQMFENSGVSGLSGLYVDEAQHLNIWRVRYMLNTLNQHKEVPFVLMGDTSSFKDYPLAFDVLIDTKTDSGRADEIQDFLGDQTKGMGTWRGLNAMDLVRVFCPVGCLMYRISFQLERDAILFKTFFSDNIVTT